MGMGMGMGMDIGWVCGARVRAAGFRVMGCLFIIPNLARGIFRACEERQKRLPWPW
jgi:hypothetical protein